VLAYFEVALQAVWPVAKSFRKIGGPKAPLAIHGSLDPTFYPNDKVNIKADCLESQLKTRDLCDCDYRRHMEVQIVPGIFMWGRKAENLTAISEPIV
jgi:hypothetical protein